MFGKIFEGEMFTRILHPTLLQIFYKITLSFLVTVKSLEDPDDIFKVSFKH